MRKVCTLSGMLILCLFTFLSLPGLAQELIGEAIVEIATLAEGKIAVERLKSNPDGSFTLYAFVQQPCSSGACMPGLQIYELDSLLQVREQETISCKPAEKGIAQNGRCGKDGPTDLKRSVVSYQEMLAAYPELYSKKKENEDYYEAAQYQTGRPIIRHTCLSYQYDSLSHSFVASKKEEMFGVALGALAESKLHIHDELKINQAEGLVSMVVGEKKDDGDKQASPYLRQSVLLSRLRGELISRHDFSFPYPMEVRLQQYVYDQDNTWKGIAYVFGPVRRFGKWETDPDPENYQLLVLDTLGNKALHHPFCYGDRERTAEPFLVSAVGEDFYCLGKGVGRKPDYHLLIFDKNGLKKQTLVNPDELFEKTVGPYKEGLSNDYSSNFVPAGSRQVPAGGWVVFGEHRYTEEISKYNQATNSQSPARYRYQSYIFLAFDEEGNFEQSYVVPKAEGSLADRPGRIELLSLSSEALQLLVYEAHPKKLPVQVCQSFQKVKEEKILDKDALEGAEKPRVLSLGLQTKEIEELNFAEGFFSLGPEGFTIYSPVNRELLLAGRQLNQEGTLQVVIKKIKL